MASAPSAPADGAHRYIQIGRYHRNPKNAEAYVFELFREARPGITLGQARGSTLTADLGVKEFRVSFADAVRSARERGTAENLRSFLNRNDPYFVFAMAMAVSGEGVSLELGFAGQSLKLPAPMRQGAIEDELTQDILEHRRLASAASLKQHDEFRTTAMHFRSYILSACAAVEAFLNRCVMVDLAEGRASPVHEELQRPCSVERRFEAWLDLFAGEQLAAINGGAEWDHFSELRRLRNSLMHATTSMLGIGLREAARQLNLVRQGVGGLILRLRELQGLPPVPFAERLQTAPECTFQSEV